MKPSIYQKTSKPQIGEAFRERSDLPCLYSNNSIQNSNQKNSDPLSCLPSIQKSVIEKMTTQHKKTASNLSLAIREMARKYGVEKLGFVTLTFPDDVKSPKEAQRRMNSFNSNFLLKTYEAYIRVYERHKDGRIHAHLVIVFGEDIKTGFNFDEVDRGTYKSACKYLRAQWRLFRKECPKYGFGRHQIYPVKSTADGISYYVGKYISKGVQARKSEDKGVRLVSYSKEAKIGTTRFQFVSNGSAAWRKKMASFAQLVSQRFQKEIQYEDFKTLLGKRWCYRYSDLIISLPEDKNLLTGLEMERYENKKEEELENQSKKRFEYKEMIERALSEQNTILYDSSIQEVPNDMNGIELEIPY